MHGNILLYSTVVQLMASVWRLYTVRNVLADFAMYVTDDAIAKLYVTQRFVK